MRYPKSDPAELARVVDDFERCLPGFWWSVGMCRVGAHASCAVDGGGPWAHLLKGIEQGDPLDSGFHSDTDKLEPHVALGQVLAFALADPRVEAQRNRDLDEKLRSEAELVATCKRVIK